MSRRLPAEQEARNNNKMTQELFHTMNIKVAAALATMGFEANTPPVTRIVREDGNESVIFWFEATNDRGEKAMTIAHGMTKGGESLNEADPENIINYLRCFAANRDEMIGLIKNTPRQVEIKNGGRKMLLSENASDETKRKSAAML